MSGSTSEVKLFAFNILLFWLDFIPFYPVAATSLHIVGTSKHEKSTNVSFCEFAY